MIENIAIAGCSALCTLGLGYCWLLWYFKGLWR